MPSITGRIAHVIYENNGFVILRIRANGNLVSDGETFDWEESDRQTEICAKGHMMHPAMGVDYTLTGKLEETKGYGVQMSFNDFRTKRPVSEKAIVEYLSHNCAGIGVRTAKAIYDLYGSGSVEQLKQAPVKVASSVQGLSVEKATKASKKLSDIEDDEELKIQIASLVAGTTAHKGHIRSMIKKLGSNAPDVIENTPYQLIQVPGIGFKVADSIAVKNGVDLESPERVSACADFVIRNWERSGGHTCIPEKVLNERIISETSMPRHLVDEHMRNHLEVGLFVQVCEHIYRRSMYSKERELAKMLSKLCQAEVRPVTAKVEGLEPDQAEAVEVAACNPVMLLTGPPGTGKTYTIRRICETFLGQNVDLCAQTGKAARRITETTGRKATTIHSLLKPRIVEGGEGDGMRFQFSHGKSSPVGSDVVIVDEASLLDIELAHSLVSAIRVGARLIIVGDHNQLPSVGPGKVLSDLIKSEAIPHISLTKIKRQGANSLIVQACHEIKAAGTPEIENQEDGDLFMWATSGDEKTIATTLDLFTQRIPDKFKFKMSDIQIVTPNKNPEMAISTYRINAEIQGRINEGTVIDNSEKSLGKKAKVTFRVGDRVINTRNTEAVLVEDGRPGEEVPIVNGDIGIVLGLYWRGTFYDDEDLDDLSPAGRSEIVNGKPKDLKMVVDFYEHTVLIPIRNNHLDLAYAVTCHKFQGSECPAVIIPLPRGANNLLCRSWIYTALSRGKELVVVVGPKTAFGYACMTPDRRRDTFLSHFVVSEMDKMLTPQVVEEDDLGWESVETVF